MLGSKEDMKKMGPAILIALAKKKGASSKEDKMDPSESGESDSEEADSKEHLEEIASDLIDAVHSKDVGAVADLLQEAFDCMKSGDYS